MLIMMRAPSKAEWMKSMRADCAVMWIATPVCARYVALWFGRISNSLSELPRSTRKPGPLRTSVSRAGPSSVAYPSQTSDASRFPSLEKLS
ncbi:MAG: hypothetical protein JWN34_5286 [Bryobacterales bacterium]|nr:hypothetical protein [Bryobacterales bacterium]